MTINMVCFMESRIHVIGRILIVIFLKVCREVIPIGAKNIETSIQDDLVSIPKQ